MIAFSARCEVHWSIKLRAFGALPEYLLQMMKIKRRLRYLIFLLCLYSAPFPALSQNKPSVYYPASGDSWQRRRPEDVGVDSALLEQAVDYAKSQGSTIPADFSTQ